jgi:YesN/AraC family two-component response regulator
MDLAILSEHKSHDHRLAEFLNGTISKEALEPSILRRIDATGMVLAFRWKQCSENRKDGCISKIQQEVLMRRMTELFAGCYIIQAAKGLDPLENRVDVIAPGFEEDQCIEMAEALLEEMSHKSIVFWCGLSEKSSNLAEHMKETVIQAEEMLSFSFYEKERGRVFAWKKYSCNMEIPLSSLAALDNEIREDVHKGDGAKAVQRLKQLENLYRREPYVSPIRVRHSVSSFIMGIIRDLEGMIAQSEYDSLINEAYDNYGKCDSLKDLFDISYNLLAQESAYISQELQQSDAVEMIIAYVNKHFREDISLQMLADRVHFSANYLSAQMKKRVGKTYIEYILSLRLKEACRLLLNSDLKVKDIAQKSGFNDTSYFNRIFRRYYVISPEQYRKAHKKC